MSDRSSIYSNSDSPVNHPSGRANYHTTPFDWNLAIALVHYGITRVRAQELTLLIRQLHWLLGLNGGVDRHGTHWVWQTYEGLHEQLPIFPTRVLRVLVADGEKAGLIVRRVTQTKTLYTLDYSALLTLVANAGLDPLAWLPTGDQLRGVQLSADVEIAMRESLQADPEPDFAAVEDFLEQFPKWIVPAREVSPWTEYDSDRWSPIIERERSGLRPIIKLVRGYALGGGAIHHTQAQRLALECWEARSGLTEERGHLGYAYKLLSAWFELGEDLAREYALPERPVKAERPRGSRSTSF